MPLRAYHCLNSSLNISTHADAHVALRTEEEVLGLPALRQTRRWVLESRSLLLRRNSSNALQQVELRRIVSGPTDNQLFFFTPRQSLFDVSPGTTKNTSSVKASATDLPEAVYSITSLALEQGFGIGRWAEYIPFCLRRS